MTLIYFAQNSINLKYYVGITGRSLKARKAQHKHQALKGSRNLAFYQAIRKYSWDNFIWGICEEVETYSEGLLREVYWISFLKTKMPSGYNMTDGGEGVQNLTEISRRKISLSKLGKPLSPQHRLKCSRGFKGRKHSQETKDLISRRNKEHPELLRTMLGKKHSQETLLKMSISHSGAKMPPKTAQQMKNWLRSRNHNDGVKIERPPKTRTNIKHAYPEGMSAEDRKKLRKERRLSNQRGTL